MIAETLYDKALANLKTAKIVFHTAPNDEEQLNIVGYHIQQSIELAIKYVFAVNGVGNLKTHDLDQLIIHAKNNHIDLYLPAYLIEHSEMISNWEIKTRYVLGYQLEATKINQALEATEEYFSILCKTLEY